MVTFVLSDLTTAANLACSQARILGGRKRLVYVRTVVTVIFDFMTEED